MSSRIIVFIVSLALAVSFIANIQGYQYVQDQIKNNRRLASQGVQSHNALCVFKKDLQTRYITSLEYLADHPEGVAGISADTIKNSLTNQKATIDSLYPLKCAGVVSLPPGKPQFSQ